MILNLCKTIVNSCAAKTEQKADEFKFTRAVLTESF